MEVEALFFLLSRRGSGGPDGGDGGHGGSIKFISFGNLRDLSHLKQNYTAGNGESGSRGRSQGKNGQDLILQVSWCSIMCCVLVLCFILQCRISWVSMCVAHCTLI